ncbi:MAG TPA: hypothetical protein VHE78_17715 [Gemmatimonadaceae bacterium]|nr:hypothetical protein [Gemmatimonadaceae bacterium]
MIRTAAFIAALLLLFLAWDVAVAGRIAQRGGAAPFRLLTGLCGFLVAPALLVSVGSGSALTGRAMAGLGWLWPLVLLLFVVQSFYVFVRRLASRWIVAPFLAFNVLVALIGVVRYAGSLGFGLSPFALAPGLAFANLVAVAFGPLTFGSPIAVLVPLLAAGSSAGSRVAAAFRLALGVFASALVGVIAVESIPAHAALAAYARLGTVRLTEFIVPADRGSLATGLRILPELSRAPAAGVLRDDLALADSLGVDVLLVRILPDGCTPTALDSLDRALEPFRRDSTLLIVELAYSRDAARELRTPAADYMQRSAANVDRMVRRLRPNYLIPAGDPYGAGASALGELSTAWWRRFFTVAASAAHDARPATRVMLTSAAATTADSTLFDWAVAEGSPVDVTAFLIEPAVGGALHVQATLAAADRWMSRAGAGREHWLIATGAPALEGEEAQRRLARHVLLWSAARPRVRGVVFGDAADYDRMTGFRTSSGRLRRVAEEVATTIRALPEPSAPLP